MTIVPGLKRAAIIVGVLGSGLDLSGCTAFQEAVGTVKTPPDEFAVTTRTPLVVPPDLSLRPPQPAAAPKGPNASNASVDLTAALGSSYSDAEKFLLTRSNALAVDPNRSVVAPIPAQQAPVAAVSPPTPPSGAEPPAVTPNPPQIASLPASPVPIVVTPSRVTADESDDAPASADAAGPKRPRRTLLRLLFGSDDAAAMQLNEEASASSATDSTMVEMASLSRPPRRTLSRLLFGSGDTATTQTAGSGGMPCSTVPVPVAAPSTPAMPAERRTLARLLFAPSAAATMSQACAPAATATTENPPATGMPGERRTVLRLLFPPGEAAMMQPQQTSAPATMAVAPTTAMMSTTPAADMPPQRRTLFRMLFPPAEAATMQAPESPAPH
jgi:hypothetical protein